MIEVRLDRNDLANIERQFRNFPGKLEIALDLAFRRTAEESARQMRLDAPRAESLLTNSIKATKIAPNRFEVGPHVEYAQYVFEGRAPAGKLPPVEKLTDWIRVKHIPLNKVKSPEKLAWVIAKSIAKEGIEPNDFMKRAYELARKRLVPITLRTIENMIRDLRV